MPTHNQIKFIHSLKLKKYRDESGLFVVEGKKLVDELLQSNVRIKNIYYSEGHSITDEKAEKVSSQELSRMSHLSTPSGILAVAEIPKNEVKLVANQWYLCLDTINDPGNLGTIIRTAEWFGISTIICSENTVDAYNPKVVQSSMGSLFRVNIVYVTIHELLSNYRGPIYGAVLNGENLYKTSLANKGVVIIGSESHGISQQLEKYITQRITIPSFGNAESLNAGIATGIILSEIKRKDN
jgi:RNA methyltransferase, TrmH family